MYFAHCILVKIWHILNSIVARVLLLSFFYVVSSHLCLFFSSPLLSSLFSFPFIYFHCYPLLSFLFIFLHYTTLSLSPLLFLHFAPLHSSLITSLRLSSLPSPLFLCISLPLSSFFSTSSSYPFSFPFFIFLHFSLPSFSVFLRLSLRLYLHLSPLFLLLFPLLSPLFLHFSHLFFFIFLNLFSCRLLLTSGLWLSSRI